jgi:hypothetical protein
MYVSINLNKYDPLLRLEHREPTEKQHFGQTTGDVYGWAMSFTNPRRPLARYPAAARSRARIPAQLVHA